MAAVSSDDFVSTLYTTPSRERHIFVIDQPHETHQDNGSLPLPCLLPPAWAGHPSPWGHATPNPKRHAFFLEQSSKYFTPNDGTGLKLP